MKAPKSFNHPTFGKCRLIPSIVAVRWTAPHEPRQIAGALTRASVKKSEEAAARTSTKGRRNPAEGEVNHSTLLTWVGGGTKALSERTILALEADENVAWVGPVYSAAQSEGDARSYFTIDPTVLVLSQVAASRVGDPVTLDPAATIDRTRSSLLKGFVIVNLPNKNAVDVAQRLLQSGTLDGIPNAVSLENTPYISPICCGGGGCGCGCGAKVATKGSGKCAPATAPFIPNDPIYPQQWGIQRLNASSAWTVTKGDPNVVVAVLDQGVDLAHPDLNLWPISYSTITHTYDGSPVGDHGTACAGIIGGRINSGLGVAGLAGDARVMAISTNFSDVQVAEGLYFAADNGAGVVSMSFGVYLSWMIWNFAIIEAALQYCQDKNVVLVAASGNENLPQSRFPGSDPRTICVGGSNRSDVRKSIGDTSSENWWGACYGPDVDVVAPCLEIPTTDRVGSAGYTPGDYDMFFNGTSSATPHVAALAGLILSTNPSLSSADVRQLISETTDKINSVSYAYLPTAGKPYGTWTAEVGYGRVNAERALLLACSSATACNEVGPCGVEICEPDPCCVSPCDPPWRPDSSCLISYEEKFFRLPLKRGDTPTLASVAQGNVIEYRVTYEHRMCALGKQQGPLLFTTTLLPGETIRLFHSERYRRSTSTQERYSVQSTFMQFVSMIHQAHVSSSIDELKKLLVNASESGSVSAGAGLDLGFINIGGSAEASQSMSVSSELQLAVHAAADLFEQSVNQASQLTHVERSTVVSTFEEKETQDTTVRQLHNANECRAVTYFVRQVVELYALSVRVTNVRYRLVAGNLPAVWHDSNDLAWLPAAIQGEIRAALALLPKIGDMAEKPRPFTLPTDGTVYNPELAHCCSCEPERAASITIRLEREKAEAMKACLEVQQLEAEVQRRRLLLKKGELGPFTQEAPAQPSGPTG